MIFHNTEKSIPCVAVQIDGQLCDISINIKEKYNSSDGYIYTLHLEENNKIKAAATKTDTPEDGVSLVAETALKGNLATPTGE